MLPWKERGKERLIREYGGRDGGGQTEKGGEIMKVRFGCGDIKDSEAPDGIDAFSLFFCLCYAFLYTG